MYGFHEAAEREQLEKAAREFMEYISQKADDSPLDRMKTYVAELLEKGSEEKREGFYKKLSELHEGLLYDGTELQQRPFDLLGSTASKDKEELFSLLQSWELLTIAFRLLDKKPESGEEWSAALQAVQAAVTHYEKQQLPMRKGLDVFDQQISYYERIARNRKATLPEEKKVVIPYELYSRFRSAEKNRGWMDAVLFCVMACRYLSTLGVTKERLQKEDYWSLPGGKGGFGIYQSRVTAGTFFERVLRFLKPESWEKPPAKVITYNNVLMLWIDPEYFGYCEEAARREKPEDGQTAGVTVDAEGNLFADDDGTRETTERIYQALEQYDELEKEKTGSTPEKLFLRKTGNRELWKKAVERDRYTEWKKDYLDAFLVGLDQELTHDENKKQRRRKADVKIMGSAKGAKKNAPRLLIGYLLFRQKERTWSGTGEALWMALEKAIKEDADGTWYGSYWAYLEEMPRELTATKENKTYTFTLRDKAVAAKKPEDGNDSAAFIPVFPPLSDGEIAVLDAWEIGKDEKPSKEEYRERLGGIDLQALNSLLKKASLHPERELPGTIHTRKLLNGRPRIKDRLGSMLLLVALFRMHGSKQEMIFAGEMQTNDETFCFDRDSLTKLRVYLMRLWERRGTRGKTYGVEVTRPEGQDEGFTLKICEQSQKKLDTVEGL